MTTDTTETAVPRPRNPNVIWLFPERSVTSRAFHFKSAQIYPLEENSNSKKYVIYEMVINPPEYDVLQPGTLYRRYTDFLALFEGLRASHPDKLQEVEFPKKHFTGNFSEGVACHRMTLFSVLLDKIAADRELLEAPAFVSFLQDAELEKACRLIDERKPEEALPILDNLFVILSKFYMDKARQVLLVLCRLVAASSYPVPSQDAIKWADLALKRFDHVSDTDLLPLYIPLIKACVYTYWKSGKDKSHLDQQLDEMKKRGINVKSVPTLTQAIHQIDPRTETA